MKLRLGFPRYLQILDLVRRQGDAKCFYIMIDTVYVCYVLQSSALPTTLLYRFH